METNDKVRGASKTHRKGPLLYWYDRKSKLWYCIHKEIGSVQLGKAGYGLTKEAAIEDCLHVNQQ